MVGKNLRHADGSAGFGAVKGKKVIHNYL